MGTDAHEIADMLIGHVHTGRRVTTLCGDTVAVRGAAYGWIGDGRE